MKLQELLNLHMPFGFRDRIDIYNQELDKIEELNNRRDGTKYGVNRVVSWCVQPTAIMMIIIEVKEKIKWKKLF